MGDEIKELNLNVQLLNDFLVMRELLQTFKLTEYYLYIYIYIYI